MGDDGSVTHWIQSPGQRCMAGLRPWCEEGCMAVDWWWGIHGADTWGRCWWKGVRWWVGCMENKVDKGFLVDKSCLSQPWQCWYPFHIGNPHLVHKHRSASQFGKIGTHVVFVSSKECCMPCLHELMNLCCEFLVLLCGKFFTNIMHITIMVQPLLVSQINMSLDSFCTPDLNGATGVTQEEHWFDWKHKLPWALSVLLETAKQERSVLLAGDKKITERR